jgi:hypothetical protein
MKFGLAFASSIGIDGATALDICRRAEAAGFESIWGGEHVVLPDSIASRYPYTADGKIPAGRTRRSPIRSSGSHLRPRLRRRCAWAPAS